MTAARAKRVFALIVGGGTGGHVLPALAVAEALVASGRRRDEIVFVGTTTGMENELVPREGYALVAQHVSNFPRRPNTRFFVSTARLVAATVKAIGLIRRRRPRVVVSVGGFASAPCVMAAALLRVPVVNVAYDAIPGFATRLAGRVARVSAVAFAECALPRREVTGAPIRATIAAVDRARDAGPARLALGIPADRFLVLVVGGSLGSGTLNATADAFVASNGERFDLAVRHVIGRRNDDGTRRNLDGHDGLLYQVVPFDDHMELSLAAADVALTRAGATTIAELTAVGVPAIVVPWPAATGRHQDANAKELGAHGAAIVVPESELTVERFTHEVERLRADPAGRSAMARASIAIGHRDAAARVGAIVERVGR